VVLPVIKINQLHILSSTSTKFYNAMEYPWWSKVDGSSWKKKICS